MNNRNTDVPVVSQKDGIDSITYKHINVFTPSDYSKMLGEQDGQVVQTPAFGSEGPKFDPQQQPLVQLS